MGKRALQVPCPARNLVPDYRTGPFSSPVLHNFIDMKNTPAWYKRIIKRFCETAHLPSPSLPTFFPRREVSVNAGLGEG